MPSPDRLVASIRELSESIDGRERELASYVAARQDEIKTDKAKLEGLKMALGYIEEEAEVVPRVRRGRPQKGLKPGSYSFRARAVLEEAGVPMHIDEIMEKLGIPLTQINKTSCAGTLRQWVKAGEYFTLPLPNTFALGPLPKGAAEKMARDASNNPFLLEANQE